MQKNKIKDDNKIIKDRLLRGLFVKYKNRIFLRIFNLYNL